MEVVLGALAVLVGFAAWLWPRAPKTVQSVSPPAPAPSAATEPKQPVIVKVAMGMVGVGPDFGAPRVILEAANAGQKKQRIKMMNLQEESTKNQIIDPRPQSFPPLPCVLDETDSITCWMEATNVAQKLRAEGITGKVRIRACVRNSYDEKFYSDWMDFNVDRFADYVPT